MGGGTVRAVPVSVPAVFLEKGLFCVSGQFNRKDGSGSGFGSWKTVPAVPVLLSVPAKTVPTVLVSGSGSVHEPPCSKRTIFKLAKMYDFDGYFFPEDFVVPSLLKIPTNDSQKISKSSQGSQP